MASNYDSKTGDAPDSQSEGRTFQESYSSSEESASEGSDTGSSSSDDRPPQGVSASPAGPRPSALPKKACLYYNQGNCKYGAKCHDPHICKYFLAGNCRNGNRCHLKHSADDRPDRRRSSPRDLEVNDDKPYRWQVNSGHGWLDIAHDNIIEAQYSMPNTKGVKIYNTRFGAISIDFNRMKVRKKTSLRIRRLSSNHADKKTEWVWYYSSSHGWSQYGKKDSKGKTAPVKCEAIEKKFQSNPDGSMKFTINTTDYEIKFQEMRQENLASGKKRKVVRRPRFMGDLTSANRGLGLGSGGGTATWQFEGDHGKWHGFKNRKGTNSVSSADIEAQYQQNMHGSMNFTLSGKPYVLDFKAWTQTNLSSNKVRKIRRVTQ